MREAKFGLVTFPKDLKDNVCAIPFGLVFDKTQVAICGMPYDFSAWYEFSDLVRAAVNVFVMELKLRTGFVGLPFNFF